MASRGKNTLKGPKTGIGSRAQRQLRGGVCPQWTMVAVFEMKFEWWMHTEPQLGCVDEFGSPFRCSGVFLSVFEVG
jgi:hypothetical protein